MAEKPKYVFSTFYKLCFAFVVIIALLIMPVYPEMIMRIVIAAILGIGIFFGFAPNEAHCEYVYSYIKLRIRILKINWSLGCPPRMFAMLVSIGFYILAVYLAFKMKLI
jgi:hypothetical protein